jgi:hypothetical protein
LEEKKQVNEGIEMTITKSILYFSQPGKINTHQTIEIAKERADELDLKNVVVATTRGDAGLVTAQAFNGYNVVIVTHATGFREPGKQELSEEMASKIRAAGGKILTTTHVFRGVDRAIQSKFDTVYPSIIIAQTLRLFGQGMKVVVEIAAMAADAGLIPIDQDVVVIAGSNVGADTAVVIQPSNSHNIFDMVIKEIIAKPRNP